MGNMFDVVTDCILAYNLRGCGLYDGPSDKQDNESMASVINDLDALLKSILRDDRKLLKNAPQKQLPMDEVSRRQVMNIYPDFDFDSLNVAILGGAGAGKLTLINALMEKKRGTSVPMAEGELQMATQFIQPTFKYLRLWYMPDACDGENYVEGYFEKRCFYAFDALLILESGKIRPADIKLAMDAANCTDQVAGQTPIAFLRTKIDAALLTGIGRVSIEGEWKKEKQRIANSIRPTLRRQLDEAGLEKIPLFLISHAGILDAIGVEYTADENSYIVDDFQLCNFLATSFESRYEFDECPKNEVNTET